MASEPTTLQEAVLYFSDPKNVRDYMVARRWPDGVTCPTCGAAKVAFSEKHNRWQCGSHHAKRQFTLKTGTIFEDSPINLDKWLLAMWQIINCKNGVSSYEIAKAIGVTQKTAWFMLSRLRDVMQDPTTGGKLSGEVEVDETYIGGKSRNMHKGKKTGRGTGNKDIVFGMLERDGKVRAIHTHGRGKPELQKHIREHVQVGSAIFSDELHSYDNLSVDYKHEVINHAIEYARGNTHTNGMENFWSLLKRQLRGTYISVEPFHLFRYLDEQVFRFNQRELNDGERLDLAVRQIVGKRLTWEKLTGKQEAGRRH